MPPYRPARNNKETSFCKTTTGILAKIISKLSTSFLHPNPRQSCPLPSTPVLLTLVSPFQTFFPLVFLKFPSVLVLRKNSSFCQMVVGFNENSRLFRFFCRKNFSFSEGSRLQFVWKVRKKGLLPTAIGAHVSSSRSYSQKNSAFFEGEGTVEYPNGNP